MKRFRIQPVWLFDAFEKKFEWSYDLYYQNCYVGNGFEMSELRHWARCCWQKSH